MSQESLLALGAVLGVILGVLWRATTLGLMRRRSRGAAPSTAPAEGDPAASPSGRAAAFDAADAARTIRPRRIVVTGDRAVAPIDPGEAWVTAHLRAVTEAAAQATPGTAGAEGSARGAGAADVDLVAVGPGRPVLDAGRRDATARTFPQSTPRLQPVRAVQPRSVTTDRGGIARLQLVRDTSAVLLAVVLVALAGTTLLGDGPGDQAGVLGQQAFPSLDSGAELTDRPTATPDADATPTPTPDD